MVLLTDVLHADGMEGARLGWAAHPDRGFADAAVSSPDSRPTIAPPATAAALAISEPPRAPIHVPGSPAQITPAAAMAAPAMIARPRPSAATREVITAATRAFNAQIKDGSGAQALRQMAQQTALREQSKMFGAIIDDLDPAGRLGFRSFDYTFTPRPNRAPEMTFRAIKPLYDDEDGTGTGFLQMGFASTEETGTTWNAGLVHRQMLPGGAWLGGGNVFFDYAPQHGHQRLSLGLEAMTLRVTLTDPAGNSAAAITDSATKDTAAPAGASVLWTTDPNAAPAAMTFALSGAEVGATYAWQVTSATGGTPITGSGTIASASQTFGGIDATGFAYGTLTVSVTLTDTTGNSADPVTDGAMYHGCFDGATIGTVGAGGPCAGMLIVDNALLKSAGRPGWPVLVMAALI